MRWILLAICVLMVDECFASVCKLRAEYTVRRCASQWCRTPQTVKMADIFTGVIVGHRGDQSIILTCGHYPVPCVRRLVLEDATYQAQELHREYTKGGIDFAIWLVPVKLDATPIGTAPLAGQPAWFYGYPNDRAKPLERSVRIRSAEWFDVTSGYIDQGDSGSPIGTKGTVQGILNGYGRHQAEGKYTAISHIRPHLAKWLTADQPRQLIPEPDPISTSVDRATNSRLDKLEQRQNQIISTLDLISQRLAAIKPGRKGDQGPAGPKGDQGPAGTPGKIDTNVLAGINARLAKLERGQRVVLVEGNKIIDDETYPPGEAIVLDIERIRKGAK